jgi:hypothetical protein
MSKKVKIKTTGDVKVVIGPSQPIEGVVPINPAEILRTGQLGTRTFPDQVTRRPFKDPTKSFLHRAHGPSNDEVGQPLPEGVDPYVNDWGQDRNRYSKGENKPETEEGVQIYGT